MCDGMAQSFLDTPERLAPSTAQLYRCRTAGGTPFSSGLQNISLFFSMAKAVAVRTG